HSSQSVSPDVTITVLSESMVAVGYQRGKDMFFATVHDSLFGSKMPANGSPTCAPTCPPTIKSRPSAICSIPLQKTFAGTGTEWNVLVAGSQTIAVAPASWPADIKTLPFGKSAECTDTIGSGNVPDHIPNCPGLAGLELEK